MTVYRQSSPRHHNILAGGPVRNGILACVLMMLIAISAGAAEETYMESEGEIFTVVNGMVGTHCTGKIVAISDTQIEIKDKEENRKAFAIGEATKICDRGNLPISIKDFTVGELVTIATTDGNKENASGIRKGPILIRLTNMQPVPIGQ